ncbi:MAG: hypothetical protein ACFKPT_02875 [Gloeotrichia echinulata GP01]
MNIPSQTFRDGTSQRNRLVKALKPDYVAVDERSLEDLLKFAQQYSQQLKYYDESNTLQGDWSPFFKGDVKKMVAYLNNPGSFKDDQEALNILTQPHFVLFLTFLQLLRYPQQQFKELTERYLDFYYQRVLQLQKKREVNDKVNVIFQLTQNVQQHLLKQGTLLNAGQDSQGVDLYYVTDEEIILNQAQVARVKNLSLEKQSIDLKQIHEQDSKGDKAFEKVLQWAIGSPNQGDKFPNFVDTAVDINYLKNLYQEIKAQSIEQIEQDQKNYLLNQLFFNTIEDFKYCFEIHYRQINFPQENIKKPTDLEWSKVYELVEKAYRKKINWERRNTLKQKRENAGFESMMKFALGNPNPGDSLPEMPNQYNTLEKLFTNLNESAPDSAVVLYIKEQLYMSVEDFRLIMKVNQNNSDWPEVYRLVEKAQTKKINFTYPPIYKTEIKNIYANSLADAKAGEVTIPQRFSTFKALPESSANALGFAITSPLLLLQEGTRTITITIICTENTLEQDKIKQIIDSKLTPFDIYISSDKQWINLNPESFTFKVGNFLLETALKIYDENLAINNTDKNSSIWTATADAFDSSDINKYLIFGDGKIYHITAYTNQRQVQLSLVGQAEASSTERKIKLYSASAIYFNSLQFRLNLDSTLPAIVPPQADESSIALPGAYPVLKILLKQLPTANNSNEKFICYESFKSIRLEKVRIQVNVKDVQNIQLRNDDSILNSQTPFQPFGNSPKVGSSFYFANTEISSKKLDSLVIRIIWIGLPNDFAIHYKDYSSLSPDTGIIPQARANTSFQASLKLLNNRSWCDIETPKSLFTQPLTNSIELSYKNFGIKDYYLQTSGLKTDADDPFEQPRYFKLELDSPDFGHDIYPLVLNKVGLETTETRRNLTVYPPYTPEIKAISLDYNASVEIDFKASSIQDSANKILQIHPFGYADIAAIDQNNPADKRYYLLPVYEEEGALYIGIRNLQPPQNISLLFQIVSGSGNMEITPPQIQWSYLSNNRWQNFDKIDILSDSTKGLVNAGIIRLNIPAIATNQHNLLPSNLHWLRATVKENPTAIPDILDIKSQAVRATFVNQSNAADHLSKPLAANSIQRLVTPNSAIKTVRQPYSSFGGKSAEDSHAFNTRVSERLRHKQRALTAWDYEHLVLENFPEIYKVKCITSAFGSDNPGGAKVTVVVIPDISNTAPFFPLEPKAPLYLLQEIAAFLKLHTSPFVNIIVKNPRYERIKYRVGIRFREGYEQGYYLNKLNEDIKRFLSPWAYEEQADITFGSVIHGSSVIHFIEKRPYVDYVTNFKLIEQISISEGSQKPLNTAQSYKFNTAQVREPDSILVSASEHIIDIITTEKYEEENFEGIGYMIIGVDFVIS